MTNSPPRLNDVAQPAVTDIRALKPPVVIPEGWLWILWIVGALILLAAAFFAWRYFRRKAEKPVVIPVVPPHVRARLKLQEALALINQPQPFCVLVSDTIRHYLEEHFNFHAPERTTEEFLIELQSSELLMPDQKQSLGEFLAVCDMVKFARYEPGPPELQTLHESAVRLIDETEPQTAVPESWTSAPATA